MAAIYDPEGAVNIDKLAKDIKDQLPVYARPQFIRILTKIDLTGSYCSRETKKKLTWVIIKFVFSRNIQIKEKRSSNRCF